MSSPHGLPDPYRATGSASFVEFLSALHPERLRFTPVDPAHSAAIAPHGTTIVALRTADGAIMAGDRRATMGNIIAQRDIEKVFAADDHSVIGIAGTAGLAVELVRLFQVELEHYEKIEGVPLSLDGKANRLATLLRGNLGMAMQGLAVVPLLAGYDDARETGRIFSYDVTGGRYEEHDFYAVGSGASFARGSLKKLFRRADRNDAAVSVALEALYDAADDDSATGGPDMARGIYPVVATVDAEGVRMLTDEEIEPRVRAMMATRASSPDGAREGGVVMSVPFYVSPEQIMRDKADFARKGIARGRSVIVLQYDGGIVFVAENPSRALHKVSELYDRIGFAAVGKYNEFESLRVAGVRLADMRGYSYDRIDVTGRSLANAYAQTLGTIFTETAKPFEVEIVVAEVGHDAADDQLYRLMFDGSVADERGYVAMGGSAEPVTTGLAAGWHEGMTLGQSVQLAVGLLRQHGDERSRELAPEQLEVAILDRARTRRTFQRLDNGRLAALLAE